MFARVITTRNPGGGFDDLVRATTTAMPDARQRPGFAGYLLLTDADSGEAMAISLWQTRQDLEAVAHGTAAGVHEESAPQSALGSMELRIFEVALQA